MYFLGIDGGGSQTRALLSEASGKIVGKGLGGASNPRATPEVDLRQHLLDAIRQATQGIDPLEVRAAHLGIAGAGDTSTHEILSQIAREHLLGKQTVITVGHDLETALESGLCGEPGIVLVAGTGSACYGRNAADSTAECGGWGDLVDDAGSGSWIGLRALQGAVRQDDQRLPESLLKQAVMDFLSITQMTEFKTRIHDQGLSRSDRSRLAPVVIELAASGDSVAALIVDDAVDELCQLAVSTRRQLELPNPSILIWGGLAEHPFFRESLVAELEAHDFKTPPKRPKLSAAAGAVLLAMKAAHVETREDTISLLANTFY